MKKLLYIAAYVCLTLPVVAQEAPKPSVVQIESDKLSKAAQFNDVIKQADAFTQFIPNTKLLGVVLQGDTPTDGKSQAPRMTLGLTPDDPEWKTIMDAATAMVARKREVAEKGLSQLGVSVTK